MSGNDKSEFCPDATALRDDIANGATTAAAALEDMLVRIERINPSLNAIITLDADGARAKAKAADHAMQAGKPLGPLHGVPCTIKDAFEVAGMRSTGGIPALSKHVPAHSADAVARLEAAGAIVVGKTNVPPWSGDFITDNALFGRTVNPWDKTVVPGGSSGGAAAAVATGMSTFELGSDIGGSIRIPAHFCGICGLKPTYRSIPMRGHVPPMPGTAENSDLSIAGPLARSARDLELLIGILAKPGILQPPRRNTPDGLRVAVWVDDGYAPVGQDMTTAMTCIAQSLCDRGAHVSLYARPAFDARAMFDAYATMVHGVMTLDLPAGLRDRIGSRDPEAGSPSPSHAALQARGGALDAASWHNLRAQREQIAGNWSRFFEDWDILLCPPAPSPAFPHPEEPNFLKRTLDIDGETIPYADLMRWSAHALFGGMPAVVAPTGHYARSSAEKDLPLGVQIIAPHGHDLGAIAVAGMIEEIGGGFVPPPIAQHS